MNNILITSAGKRVSLLNAFKKELKAIFLIKKFCNRFQSTTFRCLHADGWFKFQA
jgi:hypothetical protein